MEGVGQGTLRAVPGSKRACKEQMYCLQDLS